MKVKTSPLKEVLILLSKSEVKDVKIYEIYKLAFEQGCSNFSIYVDGEFLMRGCVKFTHAFLSIIEE